MCDMARVLSNAWYRSLLLSLPTSLLYLARFVSRFLVTTRSRFSIIFIVSTLLPLLTKNNDRAVSVSLRVRDSTVSVVAEIQVHNRPVIEPFRRRSWVINQEISAMHVPTGMGHQPQLAGQHQQKLRWWCKEGGSYPATATDGHERCGLGLDIRV
ncbi:hypothetical protein BJ166DRAFT_521322 [Pestalotiopsis sp. NC0098]|nr:hypothetical protein BJ166DRAFT_521322 [Pestalotiopsis sp. NC0098]